MSKSSKLKFLSLAYIIVLIACRSLVCPVANNSGKAWIGVWDRDIRNYGSELEIKEVRNDSVIFSLSASNGGNMGEAEGAAIIRGNTALYMDANESDTCVIKFTRYGDSLIVIDQKSGNCGAGMGVEYSGKYYNAKLKKGKSEPAETLYSIGLLHSVQQDAQFKKLVGEDYELFLNSTQLTSEGDDLDGVKAKVYASGVKGLFTFMENIVMINDKNDIWAAVIDDERIFYYTNRADYQNTLPKTIQKWKERFDTYPVIYNPQLHTAKVDVEKAHLFSDATSAATTKGYLVKGDKVIVLEKNQDWARILYRSPNAGKTIERWLKVTELSER